jgi:hypothetical protein
MANGAPAKIKTIQGGARVLIVCKFLSEEAAVVDARSRFEPVDSSAVLGRHILAFFC